jgi:hypothetical protein
LSFDFWSKYFLKMLFPFLLILLMLLNTAVFVALNRFWWKKSVDIQFTRHRAASFFLQTLLSCYTLLISGATSPLICFKQRDGKQVMVRSPGVVCYQSEWNKYFGSILFFVILYGALSPIALLVMLFVNRHRPAEMPEQNYLLSFTYNYKKHWEIPTIVRKSLFLIITGLIPAYPSSNAPYFACICLVFAFLSDVS